MYLNTETIGALCQAFHYPFSDELEIYSGHRPNTSQHGGSFVLKIHKYSTTQKDSEGCWILGQSCVASRPTLRLMRCSSCAKNVDVLVTKVENEWQYTFLPFFVSISDGLQPSNDGLHPKRDGLK